MGSGGRKPVVLRFGYAATSKKQEFSGFTCTSSNNVVCEICGRTLKDIREDLANHKHVCAPVFFHAFPTSTSFNLDECQFKECVSYEARLLTFPQDYKSEGPSPEALAHAGFFFTRGHRVRQIACSAFIAGRRSPTGILSTTFGSSMELKETLLNLVLLSRLC